MRGIALLLLAATAFGQQYNFKFYGEEEGLQNLVVQVVLQDRVGFLWVGTQNGLYRYDGSRFTAFSKSDGLPGARIESLHESIDGTLWVGTRTGLARRVGEGRFETLNIDVAQGVVGRQGIASDRQGTVYLATERGLAIASKSRQGMRFTLIKGPGADSGASSVYVENSGTVLYGCGRGLCTVENGQGRDIGAVQGLPEEQWNAILADLDGNLWIRSARSLYVRLNGSQRFQLQPGLPEATNTYPALALDPAGRLLAPTYRGLARQTEHGWELMDADAGLNTNEISAVVQDREGSIWLGLLGSGLARWLGYSQWQSWNNRDGLSRESVWSIARDQQGRLWIGTQFGLNYAEEQNGHLTWHKRGIEGVNMIRTLAPAADGSVWIGADPGGLIQLNPKTGITRRFGAAQCISDVGVRHVMLDHDGRVWVSSRGGLFRSKDTASLAGNVSFERVEPAGTSPLEGFLKTIEDSAGRIWVAGDNGLAVWSAGQWTRFTTKDGLKDDPILQVASAPDGSVWIGYRDAFGITHLSLQGDRLRLEHVTTANGLHSDKTLFLSFDARGWLWAGTDHGVDTFDGTRWRHYGHADGLIWDDTNTNAFWADSDRTVWIGTSKGLSRFVPESSPAPGVPPPVVFTAVKFGDRTLDAAYARVPYSANTLQVRFAALTFVQESNVLFRYRMAGVESRWLETAQHELNYPQLNPGEYTLEVMARNAQGVWSAEPARLNFRIETPWWLTWWFRLVCAAGAALLGWRMLSLRSRRLESERHRLETAVAQRTRELSQEKQRVLEEKARAEQENLVVQQQKREIERLLQAAQQSSRLKSEFLANMSHEIRTPMNGVMGMTDMVLATDLTAEQREYLETARYSADSLLTILNDILDFSKIEAGRLDLNPVDFSLRECLGQMAKMFQPTLAAKQLEFRVDLDADVPDQVVGDPDRLRQVLLNLIGNAIKFTDRGAVTVHVARDAGDASDVHHRRLRFAVRDTGIGIAAGKQQLIFESFRQADGSTTRKYGGTGLGLTICSRLVELMEGTIGVDSELGRGNTFHFTARFGIPELAGAGPALRNMAPAVAAGNGLPSTYLRILLAEDNIVNQRLASRLLEKRGHRVALASTGGEALARLKDETFDVILMDVQMPDMDGLETTAIIRERERAGGARTPIIALTAHTMKGDRERCLAVGMDGYITKPVEPADFIATVEAVAAQSTAAAEFR